MMQTPSGYHPRLLDARMSQFLDAFGGVLVEGPKWCGKTWMGCHHASRTLFIDDPRTKNLAMLDPRSLLIGTYPVLVDEWQDAPILWDQARRIIDESNTKGLFIFTGSATPPDDATSHTGTGRIARLRLRPMSLSELGESSDAISLADLFSGASIKPTVSHLDYQRTIQLICRGGWPSSLGLSDELAYLVPQQYVEALATFDLPKPDRTKRNPDRVRALLRSLARHTATSANMATIQADLAASDAASAESTIRDYMLALRRVYAIDDLTPWVYSLRSKSQLRMSPTHHLADPSLAAAALEATPASLFSDPETTGLLFESLAVRDLRVYAEARGGHVFHYRDNKGLEADAIVTTPDGKWAAFEVKLGGQHVDEAAANLGRLRNKVSQEAGSPAFLAIITATTGVGFTREDGVHVVPLDCLTA